MVTPLYYLEAIYFLCQQIYEWDLEFYCILVVHSARPSFGSLQHKGMFSAKYVTVFKEHILMWLLTFSGHLKDSYFGEILLEAVLMPWQPRGQTTVWGALNST